MWRYVGRFAVTPLPPSPVPPPTTVSSAKRPVEEEPSRAVPPRASGCPGGGIVLRGPPRPRWRGVSAGAAMLDSARAGVALVRLSRGEVPLTSMLLEVDGAREGR